MATFTTTSLNSSFGLNPAVLISERSTHVDFISAGTVAGQNVRGIAYNILPASSLTSTMVTLSAAVGVKFKVDTAYNNATMGIILDDRSVSIFQAVTAFGETRGQSLTAADRTHSDSETRRLAALGYI